MSNPAKRVKTSRLHRAGAVCGRFYLLIVLAAWIVLHAGDPPRRGHYTDVFSFAGWDWGYTFFAMRKIAVRIDHILAGPD